MQRLAIYITAVALSTSIVAGQNTPSLSEYVPAVSSTAVRYWYANSFESIRRVDFANLQYFVGDGKTGDVFQLRHGDVVVHYDVGGSEYSLFHTYYFRQGKAASEIAIVELTDISCGGSCSDDGIVMVFQIDSDRLVITQQLEYDQQADGTGTDFDASTNTLTIRARTRDDSADCCPRSIDIVTFGWNGKAFEEKSHRTVPVKSH